MKSIIYKTLFFAGFVMLMSCSQLTFGDKFLGDQPESSGATTPQMFSSATEADKVLNEAYRNLPYGLPVYSGAAHNKLGVNVLESLTDLCQSFRDNISDGPMKYYYNGALSATTVDGNTAYCFGSESDWTAIRYAWLFIENVELVPDYTASEKARRVAEAKMIIALSYFQMMRYIGGVTWIDHAVDINETMSFPRITFSQTVENIVALLDEAIAAPLNWKEDAINDGRMTRAGAMALKFKVLQWAASPTFNSDTKWHPQADEFTCYGSYSADRWKRALDAGKAFFDELKANGGYSLTQPAEPTHRARRLAYRSAYYDRGGTEVLISTRQGYDVSLHNSFIDQRYYSCPTLNYVDMFPWEDGSDFPADFDWKKPSKQPFFEYDGSEMVPTRDPRLYENIACPGDIYANGTAAPVYTNHPNFRGEIHGFLIMKFILQESSDRAGRPVQWSYLRLAEMMLDYAEVINEAGGRPTEEAYSMVNDVRARVGLSAIPSGMDQKSFREAVLREKALELGFEEVRWFDLVRHNRKEDFTKTLYGLSSKGNDLNNPTAFTFEKIVLSERYWQKNWDTKWYMAPIPQNEINKKYGMTQNPGW